jgi:hypothetical protein
LVWPENPADLTAFAETETSAVLRKQKNRQGCGDAHCATRQALSDIKGHSRAITTTIFPR